MTSSIGPAVRRLSGGRRRAAVPPLVALVALGLAAALAALAGMAARPAAAATNVEAAVDRWRARTPVQAVTVVLSDPGGVRSVASGRDAGRAVGVDARFRVGSVTKAFVAAVVLQLVDERRLELDAPLGRYVPASPFGDVTIRQLLSHTGGVPDFEQAAGYATDLLARPSRRWTITGVLGLVADRDRDVPPGSVYAYSNTHAVLLGQAVEAVTGRSWAHAVQRRVIDRLDLRDTTVPSGDTAAAPGVVAGWFDTTGDGLDDRVPDPWPALETSQGPAGALVSTAPDLAVFARALFEGDLVSRAARRAMTTLQPFHPSHSNYGLGVELRRPDHRTIVWGHGGSLPGYRATMWYLPSTRRVVVVLANAYRASTDDLAELLLHR